MYSRSFPRQILGSFIAALSGWVAGTACSGLLFAAYGAYESRHFSSDTLVAASWLFAFYIAFFIVPVWLFVLVPLYIFVPSSSRLWRWSMCTALGAAAGVFIIAVPFAVAGGSEPSMWLYYMLAAIVGGVTCFTGARISGYFKRG